MNKPEGTTKAGTVTTTKTPESSRRSFLTPEMIEKNPALEAAGLFAGDPLWQELREEIKRNRKRDLQTELRRNA